MNGDTTSELDILLKKLEFSVMNYKITETEWESKVWFKITDEFLQLVAAQKQRWEAAARKDEVRLACENWEKNPTLPATYMIDRIKHLTSDRTGGGEGQK